MSTKTEKNSSSEKNIVTEEIAKLELERFAEAMDLDLDLEPMDEEDREEFKKHQRIFIQAVMRGKLSVNENGEPVFKLADGGDLVFQEPSGASFMAMDRKKAGENVAKMYVTMAEMCGSHVKTFATMKNRDLKVCTTVATLFLA